MSTIRRRHSLASSPRSVRGVGMIEVLVSVLVLAIGLLGIAAMQATALRNSQGSLQRSQGVVYTYTILDAMRANAVAARAGTYDMPLTCAIPADGTIVQNDQRVWMQNVQANLGPAACGAIQCNAGLCTITVRWDDSPRGGAVQTFTTTARI